MNPTSITQDQFLTSLRYLIVSGGSYAAGKGYISSDMLNNLLAVAAVLGPLAWGLYANWQKSQQNKVTAAVGVQAGINLTLSGNAVDHDGNPISKFAADATPPKIVTVASAAQIVKDYAPPTGEIVKS